LINKNKAIKGNNDNAIQQFRQMLEDERRKSMVDEGKIKEIQKVLNEKIKEAN
jgi:hypothetical protein